MVIGGVWLLCSDGAVRPVLKGEVRTADGSWIKVSFLLDTGADCTVFNADILQALGFPPLAASDPLGGVGGVAASVVLETEIRFSREDGTKVVLRGRYAAFTDPESLDTSVLGRDITNLFAVIVDRPGDFVALLGQRHHYVIQET